MMLILLLSLEKPIRSSVQPIGLAMFQTPAHLITSAIWLLGSIEPIVSVVIARLGRAYSVGCEIDRLDETCKLCGDDKIDCNANCQVALLKLRNLVANKCKTKIVP